MAKIKFHAGDFGKGDGTYAFGAIEGPLNANWKRESCILENIEAVEIATEDSVKRIGGTVGWGIAGGVLLGPVGLLAGLLAGGRGKDVTFVARLKSGRKFMATTDSKTYTKIAAGVFK